MIRKNVCFFERIKRLKASKTEPFERWAHLIASKIRVKQAALIRRFGLPLNVFLEIPQEPQLHEAATHEVIAFFIIIIIIVIDR